MAKEDRITNAIDKMIEALEELKDAWIDAQEFYTPKVVITDPITIETPEEPISVTISDAPPVGISNATPSASGPVLSFGAEPLNIPPTPAPAPVPTPIPEFTPNITQPQVDNSQEQTYFCENCGTKLRPGAKFCASCGMKV